MMMFGYVTGDIMNLMGLMVIYDPVMILYIKTSARKLLGKC